MSLYVPESAEEDVVVECVAKHQTLDAESNIAAIHIIKIEGNVIRRFQITQIVFNTRIAFSV